MKTFFTLSLHLLISSFLFAQAPQGIPYQAVMRNADGTVLASSAVNLTFMIHDGTADGTVVYQESHSLASNAQGLVSCVVGNGVVSQGNFSNINWGVGAKFLHVMMNGTDLGTQQMLSVPYALYAGSTHVSVSPTGDTLTVGGQSVIVPGISATNPTNNIPTSGMGSVVLPGNNTCVNEFINVVGCNGQTSLTYDGRTYDLVEIGGQCWFADNLATDQYRNGDPIPTGLDNNTWSTTTNGAFAIYNNDPANDATYGKLYNWYTTVDSRGLCPTGWHVPSDCEWMYLEGSLGMSVNDQVLAYQNRGNSEGGKLKATTSWNLPNQGANNSSGFSALAGAMRVTAGDYYNLGIKGNWWSSSEHNASGGWNRTLNFDNSIIDRYNDDKPDGFSVRCIKDSETTSIQGCTDGAACNFMANANQDDGSCLYQNATCDDGNANTINDVINGSCVCAGTAVGNGIFTQGNGVTDINGNTYTSIIINGQEWMQQNLAVTKYRNGDPIPTGLSDATWQTTTSGAYAIYNNDEANNTLYGKLYNWYTTIDSRGLCPTGWHVPSDAEWSSFINYLDPNSYGGWDWPNTAGGKMKSTTEWNSPNAGATNESGFTGLPGGYRVNDGTYNGIGIRVFWWSSQEFGTGTSWHRSLYFNDSNVIKDDFLNTQVGFSVRCLRD
jgi:uncharacterized protein (TIGR02145 family)